MDKKLYLVTLRGMTGQWGSQTPYGKAYVVAENTNEAYEKVRAYLDKNNLGFAYERDLENIQTIAYDSNHAYGGNGLPLLYV